jgi:hypothetical protein
MEIVYDEISLNGYFDRIASHALVDAEHPLLVDAYGPGYVEKIWQWFNTEKIPVVQAWLLTAERVPCFSIHLSTEAEDESKAAISDFFGEGEDADIGINSFSVNLDVGIHGSKAADQVLWMYYIASYILFRYKDVARTAAAASLPLSRRRIILCPRPAHTSHLLVFSVNLTASKLSAWQSAQLSDSDPLMSPQFPHSSTVAFCTSSGTAAISSKLTSSSFSSPAENSRG